jgi:hypothetical protein
MNMHGAFAAEKSSPRAREQRGVQAECERLADAIAVGGSMNVLLARLHARHGRLVELEAAVAASWRTGRRC